MYCFPQTKTLTKPCMWFHWSARKTRRKAWNPSCPSAKTTCQRTVTLIILWCRKKRTRLVIPSVYQIRSEAPVISSSTAPARRKHAQLGDQLAPWALGSPWSSARGRPVVTMKHDATATSKEIRGLIHSAIGLTIRGDISFNMSKTLIAFNSILKCLTPNDKALCEWWKLCIMNTSL